MTVASSTARVSYAGDGASIAFAVPFYFLADADLKAIHKDAGGVETTWANGVHYTLSGAGSLAGGTLTVNTSPTDYTPASGETLTILRDVALTQDTDLTEGDPLPAATLETALDKLTMITQQIDEQLGRSVRLAKSSTLVDVEMAEGANQFLRWNSVGTALEAVSITVVNSSAVTITAFAESLLDDADAAAARATLGVEVGVDVQAYDADIPTAAASQAEMEAGSEAALRSMSPLRVAQAIAALAPTPNYEIGTFTRDASLASGNQTVTMANSFTPKVGLFISVVAGASKFSIGLSDGTNNYAANDRHSVTPDTWSAVGINAISVFQESGNAYEGDVNSWSNGSFEIGWTKIGTITGTINVYYLVMG